MTLVYNLVDYFLMNKNENEIYSFVDKKKNKNIFDVGSFQGMFTKKIIEIEKKKLTNNKSKFFIFDQNPKAKNYVSKIVKDKNVFFFNYGLNNKKEDKKFHINKYFEASGSSFQTLIKNDTKWNISRRFILNIFNFIAQIGNFLKNGQFNKLGKFETTKVHASTIDLFCKKKKIKEIDLLKIDTEGHEEYVLKGAEKLLKKNKIKIIYVEVLANKNNFKKKKNRIINYL